VARVARVARVGRRITDARTGRDIPASQGIPTISAARSVGTTITTTMAAAVTTTRVGT
jgi:hypothetical protein